MKKKVLVLGPGKKTRGGITSVIKAHAQTNFWKKFNCIWIETYIDRGIFLKILFFIKGLYRFIINLPDSEAVHIHLSCSTSAFRKNIFLKAAKLSEKKVILHLHSPSAMKALLGPTGQRKRLYQNMLESADAIISLSALWKSQITNVINRPIKIHVVYNPCDSVKPLEHIEKQNEILYAGKLNQLKGYLDLINAFNKIANKYPDWKIVFAGNGEIEKGYALTKKLKIDNQIVFKGWVSGREKEELFSRASIFCLPSYSEGFPMAVLDAWAYGLPVITTPVGGLPDVLINGKNALVFNPGDIASLTNHIEELITSEVLRNKLCEASLELKKGLFNIDTISNQLNDIYTELTS